MRIVEDQSDELAAIEKHALPTGWTWGTVVDVGAKQKNAIVDGPFGSNLKLSDYVADGTVPVLTTKNLSGKYDDLRYVRHEKFEELKRSAVYPNDILVAKIGSCGKTGIYPANMPPAIIPANLLKVTLNDRFDKKYVFHYFNSPFFQRALKTIIRASAQPAFGVTSFRRLPLPIAPLSDQLAVVAELEKQFSRLDEAVANLQRVKANLKRYKASVLKDAVEGRLVPTEAELARREGRAFETGEQLLERILEERRDQWKGRGKYREPAAPNDVVSFSLPEGWSLGTLDQLHLQIADVDHKMPRAVDVGVPYVSTKDFFGDEGINFKGAKRISTEDFEALCRKVRPENGDILLSRYGTIGEVRLVTTDEPFQASYSVAILKPVREQIPVSFLATVLRSDVVISQIKRDVRATAQPDLGLAHIRQFVVPIPPIGEQKRIVAETDRCLSIVRGVEAEVDVNLKRAQALRQSVLRSAFRA